MAATLIIAFTFLQVFREAGFVDALEGNCRLFSYNKVVKFNLHKEICCDGTVYVKDLDENGNEKTKCCYGRSSTMYDVETQECCGGEIIWRDSFSKGCCQGKVYNKERHTCCNGQIKSKMVIQCCGNEPVNPYEGVQCCGGAMYDSRKDTCCNGCRRNGIGECCGDVLLENPADDICCQHNGATRLHMEAFGTRCCGLDKYRPEEQLCCKSVVRNKIDANTECCGNTTFDITKEVCCHGHVLPREPGEKSCCVGQLYDEDNYVCCEGKVCSGRGRAKCCNKESYQDEREVCFNGLIKLNVPHITGIVRLVENCTAAGYLSTNQFECGGKLIIRSRGENACCNKTPYNTADHLCCNVSGSSLELVKKSRTHDRCCGRASYDSKLKGCCNFDKVYNLEKQICNEEGVHPRYGNIKTANSFPKKLYKDKYCKVGRAKKILYNSNTSVCTPIGVVALPEGLDICGNKTFKRDLFICCRGKVFAKYVRYEIQQCCPNPVGKETFIPASQTCFNGRVKNIPEEHAGICRGEVYDSRTHGCDVVGEIRSNEEIDEGPNVCWYNETHYSYFDETNKKCCNGHVIDSVFTCCAEENDCCNHGDIQGYNRETHVCCGGGVLRGINPTQDCRGNHCSYSQDKSFLCCQEAHSENIDGDLTCDGNLVTGRLRNNSIICRGKVYDHGTDCCDDISYDNETKICCGGDVLERNGSKASCCGNHVVSEKSQGDSLCCESSFYEHATGHSCCGGVKYNLKNETCCTTGGKTYVFPSKDGLCCSNGEDYDDTLHTCCDGLVHKYITNGRCCGNDVIRDPTREGCFNDRVYQLHIEHGC